MGLDTSHDCWHGAYSAFHRWRCKIAEVAGYGNLNDYAGFFPYALGISKGRTEPRPWPAGDVLTELLSHSDCDGTLPHELCSPLADRLESLLPALIVAGDGGGHIRSYAQATERFIAGLRTAAAAGESVEFG